ncbi:response regulator transcription factor [Bacillus sp. FJAT-27986]|uniref:response regulator transcription factor n=1 Tax=Bacillus sp. FJAT-27986 TaxID=1743146 RepID=UPI00098148F3|nr:response regulator [Bacillus sp. FJAT-27986]
MTMYKVIIVEDDRIIRQGLCKTIPWEHHGFCVAGEAGDGEIAMELIEQEQPQVVVSDINMPFMNGIEMAKLVKEKSPTSKIIFLTGYEDFNYAQEAIKLRAFDYLLKPVDSTLLLEKAKEAAFEWEKERADYKKIQASIPLLQQNFLQKLARQEKERVDIEEELFSLGIHLEGPFYSSMLIHCEQEEGLIDKFSAKIATLISESVKPCMGVVLNAGENEVAIFLSLETNQNNRMNLLANNILKLMGSTRLLMTITLGRIYNNLFELSNSFLDCRLAMDIRHIMGHGQIYSIDDAPSDWQISKEKLIGIERKLEEQIILGLPGSITKTLDELNEVIFNCRNLTLKEMKILAIKFSSMLFYEIEKWKQEEMNSFDSSIYYDDIMGLKSLNEMMEILQRLVQEWALLMNKGLKNNRYSLVDQAINYMKESYQESGLTLLKVAKQVHVSPPYLSNLFKVEKGFNFGDFLLELRMNKAIDILTTEYVKTYEVSERVGYNNPQYFSICFKKYTGYTPAEFRKKHRA